MDSCKNPPKIAILGAGVSGLCAAIQLSKQLELHTFTIFDENPDVGGTWLVNTYPGCACDVPSHLYSYSFEPNPYWTKSYSSQTEILEYLQNVAKKYDLYPKIKFQHKVIQSEWDDTLFKWRLTVRNLNLGEETTLLFDIVICGIGGLRIPNWPEQFESFQRPKMHSAQWDSSVTLKDKVVAIVGSGASAVQIVPEIVDKVKRLIIYQRHAPWVLPKPQMEFPNILQWAFGNLPGVQWTLRNLIFLSHEFCHAAFLPKTLMSRLAEIWATCHLYWHVWDPQLRQKLMPNYQIGCKRITPSNDYYPALTRPNVSLITSKISKVTPDSLITEDGSTVKPDVLILATGFKVQDFFAPLLIKGRGGEDILQTWKKNRPSAYGGMASHSLPNWFFLLGPNTGLGHNSIIFTIECQVNWMIQVIREMTRRNAQTAAIKQEAEEEYMDNIMTTMKSTVWGTEKCGSWYSDDRGVNTTIWPETLVAYYSRLKTADFSQIDFE